MRASAVRSRPRGAPTPRPGPPPWLSPVMTAQHAVPAAALALFRVTEGARTAALTGAASAKTLESRPRVPGLACASAWEAARRCPLARPRSRRLSRCTPVRALGHARGRAHGPGRPAHCYVTRRSSGPAKTMAPHLPSVPWATSPLTWRCCGRPKTAAAERLVVRETRV